MFLTVENQRPESSSINFVPKHWYAKKQKHETASKLLYQKEQQNDKSSADTIKLLKNQNWLDLTPSRFKG